MRSDYQELQRIAEQAAQAGGAVLRTWFGSDELEVGLKDKNDLVTRADRESEETIVQILEREVPDHRILGEEGGYRGHSGPAGDAEFEWILDPLDGTSNFVHGLPFFCVSVACRHRGELVAGVVFEPPREALFSCSLGSGATRNGEAIHVSERASIDEAFLATGFPFRAHEVLDGYLETFRRVFLKARGLRRCGAAALDLAYTSAGIFDGFFELGLGPWDVAAGALLVREAGGVVTDFSGGESFVETGDIVAAQPKVHPALLAEIESLRGSLETASFDGSCSTREVSPELGGTL